MTCHQLPDFENDSVRYQPCSAPQFGYAEIAAGYRLLIT
jgi:hypothetical protein